MTEDTVKAPAKKAAAKKPAAAKTAAAPKTAAVKQLADAPKKAVAAKKPAAKAELTSGLKVTQIMSGIHRGKKQQATLKGLGLGKMHRSRILPDTPATHGMINAVSHLVTVEKIG